MARFEAAGIPHARIQTIAEVRDMQAVARKLTTTRTPEGRTIRLPPAAVDLAATPREYAFAPRYGEHTGRVLRETGCSEDEIADLRAGGIVPA
jgi:crotonobetainyl-CoA:carnitine CoA-transferase CaiB-like acyl-CoA transferase